MDTTETHKEGYLDRLKKAIGGVVIGLVLLIASFRLLWWNESNSLDKIKSTNFSTDIIKKNESNSLDKIKSTENHDEEDIVTNWYYRIGGFLMMWGGLFFLSQPLSKIVSCIPLLKNKVELDVPYIYIITALYSLIITATTITIFWFRYRPLDYIGIIVLLIIYILYIFSLIYEKVNKFRQQKQ
ncbi:MAG TPA: TMEM43 family protein [Planctomycetota bacterium]|nr:TMEM43 family protein [Planctomycetota bacterium]